MTKWMSSILLGLGLGLGLTWSVGAQPGPFTAQIQRALNSNQNVTFNNVTVNGTCTGCGGLPADPLTVAHGGTGVATGSNGPYLPLAGGTMTGTITSTIGTITVNTPVLTATQTWNAGGVTFEPIFLNVTNTASAAASRLIDLQVAGSSEFSVDAVGAINVAGAAISINPGGNASIIWGNSEGRLDTGGVSNGGAYGITNNGSYNGTVDTKLCRDAAGVFSASTTACGTFGRFRGNYIASSGSTPTVANVGANSCGTTAATIAGNDNAWVITVGATAGTQCRVAFTTTAPTGWVCASNDDTTTVAVRTTPVDTTHLDVLGAFTAGDKVSGVCFSN